MALEIFKLVGSIFVNSEEADKSIAKTDKKAQSVGSTLVKGIGTAAKWGAGIATAAGTGVAAISTLATKSSETADRIDKMSEKIGISKKGFQEWDYVMSQNGMNVEKLQSGIKTMVQQMDMAASGNTNAIETFDKLNLSWDDGTGKLKSQEQMMEEAMIALADMENGTEKARLATELFGKAGVEMMPMLNKGSKEMNDLKDRAHDLGIVMSDEAVNAGVKLGDTMDDVKKSLGGMITNLGVSAMPILQTFAEFLLTNMPMIQGMFSQLAPVIAQVFTNLLPPIMQLVQTLLPPLIELFMALMPVVTEIISMILPIFIELLNMILPPLIEIVQAVLPPLLEIIKALMPILQIVIELLKPIIELFSALIGPIIELVASAITPLVKILADLINMTLKPIIPVIKLVADVINSVLGNAINYIKGQIDNLKGVFNGLITFFKGVFTGNWRMAFDGLKQMVTNIFKGIVNAVKLPINTIISLINGFIKGLNRIKIPDWVPGVGGYGLSIPEIPMLAKGGTINRAGKAIVGEAGPELLDLPAGAKVTPLDKVKDKEQNINLKVSVKIENFYNNSDTDIEKLSDDLAFLTKRKLEGGGGLVLAPV